MSHAPLGSTDHELLLADIHRRSECKSECDAVADICASEYANNVFWCSPAFSMPTSGQGNHRDTETPQPLSMTLTYESMGNSRPQHPDVASGVRSVKNSLHRVHCAKSSNARSLHTATPQPRTQIIVDPERRTQTPQRRHAAWPCSGQLAEASFWPHM